MKSRDPRQGTDIFGICGDGIPDFFHFSIMAFESLIVVLLSCGEVPVALGHLLLELSLAQGQFFQYAFNTVQSIVAIRHVRISASGLPSPPPSFSNPGQATLPPFFSTSAEMRDSALKHNFRESDHNGD